MYVCMYVCVYVCMHACMHVCVYVIYMYACMRTKTSKCFGGIMAGGTVPSIISTIIIIGGRWGPRHAKTSSQGKAAGTCVIRNIISGKVRCECFNTEFNNLCAFVLFYTI